jgi:hypothetical protein
MADQEVKKRTEGAPGILVSDMSDYQLNVTVDMLKKEQASRAAKGHLAGIPGQPLAEQAVNRSPRGAREILANILEGEERKCLEKIGELQEMRKRLELMYLSDVEAVLELSYKFHSFDKR